MSKYSEGFGGSAAEDCFQDAIERVVSAEGDNEGPEGFKFGEVDIGELSFTPPDVDEAQAWQIVIPLESTSVAGEGLEPNFYLDQVPSTTTSVMPPTVSGGFRPWTTFLWPSGTRARGLVRYHRISASGRCVARRCQRSRFVTVRSMNRA